MVAHETVNAHSKHVCYLRKVGHRWVAIGRTIYEACARQDNHNGKGQPPEKRRGNLNVFCFLNVEKGKGSYDAHKCHQIDSIQTEPRKALPAVLVVTGHGGKVVGGGVHRRRGISTAYQIGQSFAHCRIVDTQVAVQINADAQIKAYDADSVEEHVRHDTQFEFRVQRIESDGLIAC